MQVFWIVQATVTIGAATTQIPTFYLNADVQGIMDEEGCKKVARDIVDPFHEASVSVNCDKWQFAIKETG
jgi:uncharacterized protein YabE (DUF348 family)